MDNQTAFIAGEGSSLTVEKADNTGAVISATGNGTIEIQNYTGKNLHNYDTIRTTGGSIGFTAGNVPLSNIGFSQETGDKEGTARNTVTGNVTTKETVGDAVNRDMSRANETTRDTFSRTNINVESQTIQYVANPDRFIEDLNLAKIEVESKKKSVNEFIEKVKNELGLNSNDKLEIIFTDVEENENVSYGYQQAFSTDKIKSVEDENKVLYGVDENGNKIYARDRSKENFEKDIVDGNDIKLYIMKGKKLVIYDTKNKIVYMSVEAAQIDVLNGMNIISTNPSFNKEMRADITEKEVYNENSEKIKIYFVENIKSGTRSESYHDLKYKNRVQVAHTHGTDNKHDQSKFHATEVFSPADIEASILMNVPISVATPGDSKYKYGPGKIYIYDPKTQEIDFFGIPKNYNDILNETRFRVNKEKNDVRMEMIQAPKK